MYLKYSTKVKVGVTIFTSAIFACVLIFFTIGMNMDSKMNKYTIVFKDESVNGLTTGSTIKLLGVEIGSVGKIQFSKEDISSIIVSVEINDDVVLKKDMYATMNAIGITGLKYIEITGGTNESEPISPNGYITSKKSPFADIAEKMETMSYKVTELLTNLTEMTGEANRSKFASALSNLEKLTEVASGFSQNVSPKLEMSITHLNDVLKGTDLMIQEITPVISDVKLISSKMSSKENVLKIENILTSSDKMVSETSKTIEELKVFIQNMNMTLNEKNSSTTELLKSIETISVNLEQFTEKINRDPSILITGEAENENIGR